MPRKEYVKNLTVLCGMDRVEHLSCEERLRELFSLEWDWWIASMHANSSKQGEKKMDPRYFKYLPSDRTRDNAWAQTEAHDVPSECDGKHFLLYK